MARALVLEDCATDLELLRTLLGRVSRPVTASAGVAVFPDPARDGEELLQLAYHAMYLAKEGGGDRVEIAAEATPAPGG
jgi:GGDEF domain-containing protein